MRTTLKVLGNYVGIAAIAAGAATLSGCGGGGGGGSSATATTSGIVTMGRVTGATVYARKVSTMNSACGVNCPLDSDEQKTAVSTNGVSASSPGYFQFNTPSYQYVIVSFGGTDQLTGKSAMPMATPTIAAHPQNASSPNNVISLFTTLVALAPPSSQQNVINAIQSLGVSYNTDVTAKSASAVVVTPAAAIVAQSIQAIVVAAAQAVSTASASTSVSNQIQSAIMTAVATQIAQAGITSSTSTATNPLLQISDVTTSTVQVATTSKCVSGGSATTTLAGIMQCAALTAGNTLQTDNVVAVTSGTGTLATAFQQAASSAVQAVVQTVTTNVPSTVSNGALATSGSTNTDESDIVTPATTGTLYGTTQSTGTGAVATGSGTVDNAATTAATTVAVTPPMSTLDGFINTTTTPLTPPSSAITVSRTVTAGTALSGTPTVLFWNSAAGYALTDPNSQDVLTFSMTGAPSGVVINPVTGAISGTPSTPGSYTMVISVTDGLKNTNGSDTGPDGTTTLYPLTIQLTVTSNTGSTGGTGGTGGTGSGGGGGSLF